MVTKKALKGEGGGGGTPRPAGGGGPYPPEEKHKPHHETSVKDQHTSFTTIPRMLSL